MPSEFLKEKLGEIDARIAVLEVEIARADALREELATLERARAALRGDAGPASEPTVLATAHRADTGAGLPGRRRAGKPLAPEAERVAGVVLAILEAAPGLTVDELAERADVAPGTLHRLLGVLVRGGRATERGGRFSAV